MKKPLIALSLFTATLAGVVFYPALQSNAQTNNNITSMLDPVDTTQLIPTVTVERPSIELVFVLDTTSSMSGFIAAAKEKVWSIASTMASADPAPEIKIGLVAFRDRGDAYVTQVTDLSEDLDTVYATLMDFQAQGGGDGPESVNEALFDAINKISWSQGDKSYKLVFLVGDAPPHMDYAGEVQYPETLRVAGSKGIIVNTIQSGADTATAREWQRIAGLSQGDFFNVASDGAAVAVATPFDRELATLSTKLDETRLYFGNAAEKAAQKVKKDSATKVHARASVATRARRATFNASASGVRNFLGKGELVDAISSGRVELDEIAEAELPSAVAALAPKERKSAIMKTAGERRDLQAKIKELAQQREDYIAAEIADDASAEESLDHKIYETVRRQAQKKGLYYELAPKY